MDYARVLFHDTVNAKMAYIVPMVNTRNISREYRGNDTDIGTPQHKETNFFHCHSVTNPIRDRRG